MDNTAVVVGTAACLLFGGYYLYNKTVNTIKQPLQRLPTGNTKSATSPTKAKPGDQELLSESFEKLKQSPKNKKILTESFEKLKQSPRNKKSLQASFEKLKSATSPTKAKPGDQELLSESFEKLKQSPKNKKILTESFEKLKQSPRNKKSLQASFEKLKSATSPTKAKPGDQELLSESFEKLKQSPKNKKILTESFEKLKQSPKNKKSLQASFEKLKSATSPTKGIEISNMANDMGVEDAFDLDDMLDDAAEDVLQEMDENILDDELDKLMESDSENGDEDDDDDDDDDFEMPVIKIDNNNLKPLQNWQDALLNLPVESRLELAQTIEADVVLQGNMPPQPAFSYTYRKGNTSKGATQGGLSSAPDKKKVDLDVALDRLLNRAINSSGVKRLNDKIHFSDVVDQKKLQELYRNQARRDVVVVFTRIFKLKESQINQSKYPKLYRLVQANSIK